MIGYYVHHQGRGHAHRALAFARAWAASELEEVTGLSTLPAPPGWPGPWVRLDPDDVGPTHAATAGGLLHWAPLGNDGLARRMSTISGWITQARPSAVVVDVSVEVLTLVRLHGVPVVAVVLPGRRDDAAHVNGFRLADALVCAWPAAAEGRGRASMTPGLPSDLRLRLRHVGGISRLRSPLADPGPRSAGRHAVVLQGRGGDLLTQDDAAALARRCPGWEWTVLGGHGEWREDPADVLAGADVVVAQAGQGSVADVATARRPAVVVPSARPHDEQVTMAGVLHEGGWPVVACASTAEAFAPRTLERAAGLDGDDWEGWCDGSGGARMAAVVRSVALAGTGVPAGAGADAESDAVAVGGSR